MRYDWTPVDTDRFYGYVDQPLMVWFCMNRGPRHSHPPPIWPQDERQCAAGGSEPGKQGGGATRRPYAGSPSTAYTRTPCSRDGQSYRSVVGGDNRTIAPDPQVSHIHLSYVNQRQLPSGPRQKPPPRHSYLRPGLQAQLQHLPPATPATTQKCAQIAAGGY